MELSIAGQGAKPHDERIRFAEARFVKIAPVLGVCSNDWRLHINSNSS
jgi:hypothetical protein